MLIPTSRWIDRLTDREGISVWDIHSNNIMIDLVPPTRTGVPADLAPALEYIEDILQHPPFCPVDEMLTYNMPRDNICEAFDCKFRC